MATQTGGAVADLGLALYADMNAEESYVAADRPRAVPPFPPAGDVQRYRRARRGGGRGG